MVRHAHFIGKHESASSTHAESAGCIHSPLGMLRSTDSAVRPWYWGSLLMACMMRSKSPSSRLRRTESPTLVPELMGSAPAGALGEGRGAAQAALPASMTLDTACMGDTLQENILHALMGSRGSPRNPFCQFQHRPSVSHAHAAPGLKVVAVVIELLCPLQVHGVPLL